MRRRAARAPRGDWQRQPRPRPRAPAPPRARRAPAPGSPREVPSCGCCGWSGGRGLRGRAGRAAGFASRSGGGTMTAGWEVGGGLEQPPESAPARTGVLVLGGAKTSLLRRATQGTPPPPAPPKSRRKPTGLRRNCRWQHLRTPGQELSLGGCLSRSPGQVGSAVTHLCVKKGFDGLTCCPESECWRIYFVHGGKAASCKTFVLSSRSSDGRFATSVTKRERKCKVRAPRGRALRGGGTLVLSSFFCCLKHQLCCQGLNEGAGLAGVFTLGVGRTGPEGSGVAAATWTSSIQSTRGCEEKHVWLFGEPPIYQAAGPAHYRGSPSREDTLG
ncbi:uncharacterized protein LOC123394894 [Mustela putorius furo]|uniref:Uncharacterized protein LOC123394894 n=1 Tax=Mustela putorius furo TaxID=9669 RepID=A0A8U0SMP2_MUSPF|nr:uncharacterized protein LOC123394894 [Mustela putorius furo]